MRLTPLGCSAGMPTGGEPSSGYLVEHDGSAVLLDAGPGIAVALTRAMRTRTLDDLAAVFITHEHTDHLWDVLPIGKTLLSSRLERDERIGETRIRDDVPRVPLLVPRGARQRLTALAALYPVRTHPLLDRAFDLAFDVIEYAPGDELEVAGMRLRWELLQHVEPDCGIRIDAGDASLVYTGDTGSTPAIARLAEGAGTLLCESTLEDPDTTGHGHLSPEEAGRCATDADVAALVLTHFSSPDPAHRARHVDRAARAFDGPVSAAHPFDPIEICSPRKAFA